MAYLKRDEIRQLHLELTNRCNAACPQCDRNVLGGDSNPRLHLNSLSLEDIRRIFSPSFCRQLEEITFSGVHGDPMVAPEVAEILKYFRQSGAGVLEVHTNGGMRSPSWWEKIAKVLSSPQDSVTFGIDGLGETHALYRRNTQWEKVTKNMRAFIQAGGRARWSFLVFKHNEHQVEEAKRLAKEWGCISFRVRMTSRFHVMGIRNQAAPLPVLRKIPGREMTEDFIREIDGILGGEDVENFPQSLKDYGFDYQIEETSRAEYKNKATVGGLGKLENHEMSLDQYLDHTRITCQERGDGRLYVDAQGRLWPCCYIGGDTKSWHYRHRFRDDVRKKVEERFEKDFNSLLVHGMEKVLEHPWFSRGLEESWKHSTEEGEFPRLKRCSRTCGEWYRPNVMQNMQTNFEKTDVK
jgi:MoaA/NifB/PqqE/SkfB family radical SAM enzyme